MTLVKENHYQLACTRYFEITHSSENQPGFNHPNQYFEESRKLLAGDTTSSQHKPRQSSKMVVKKESGMKSESDVAFEELDDVQLMSMDVDEMMASPT